MAKWAQLDAANLTPEQKDIVTGWLRERIEDDIKELRAENARLREALKLADEYFFQGKSYPCEDITCSQTVCSVASRVRNALRSGGEGGGEA
jgi:hypothetical protein